MLEIRDVSKRLGPTRALDHLSLELGPGERLVIHGANGAGKSTLLKVVAGVLVPDRGAVLWERQALSGRESKLRRIIGYVPEAADPPGHLTVADLLHFVAAAKACAPVERELVERLHVVELLDKSIAELSLGQRRRACLAAALTGDPRLLLLDEPTNGLDAASIEVLGELLSAGPSDRAVLLATHDMGFAERVETRRLRMVRGSIGGAPDS